MVASAEWVPVARAVAERLAGQAGFGSEATCDVRLAVDEACTAVVGQVVDGGIVTCAFEVEPGLMEIVVSGEAAEVPAPFESMSWRILRAVTDELSLRHQPGRELSIRIAKRSPPGTMGLSRGS